MDGTYISSKIDQKFVLDNDCFTYYPDYAQTFDVTIDADQHATIKANLGFQGYDDFMVDLNSNYWVTWSQDCINNLGRSCSDHPTYAVGYFN
jgi:hypothetical protein